MIRRRAIYAGSVLHGLWMVALALLLLTRGCATGDEVLLVRLASALSHPSTEDVAERYGERFLFVNVAYDRTLVNIDADRFPVGDRAIVDRAKLAAFFRMLSHADVRYVLCDVFFEVPSSDDEALARAVGGLRDVIFPTHIGADGRPARPVIGEVPTGLAQYDLHDGAFLKLTLVHDGAPESIPLQMHRALYPRRKVTGVFRLNTFIPDMYVPVSALGEPITLGDLLILGEAAVQELARDRIVVIGDFTSPADYHDTVLGPMPGPLILANTYLAVRGDGNRIRLSLLLFLWAAFSAISLLNALSVPELRHAALAVTFPWWARGERSRFRRLLVLLTGDAEDIWLRGLGNVLFLALVSIASYFLFGVHLHVLALAVYLSFAAALVTDHFAPGPSWWQKVEPVAAAGDVTDRTVGSDGPPVSPSVVEEREANHVERSAEIEEKPSDEGPPTRAETEDHSVEEPYVERPSPKR